MILDYRNTLLVILSLCSCQVTANLFPESFDEELVLRPERDGRLVSRFAFTTVLDGAYPRDPETLGLEDHAQHYTLFPLALGQLLREYAITELHLTLNAGKWNYENWGYPEEFGVGTGAELWAWMGDAGPMSVDERWTGLRNALAGLFCASLGSLDDQRTTSPTLTFRPEGHLPQHNYSYQLRHATLPSEHVCTENLTPFLKLLPCKSLSGIASLLNPHRLFDADWHGLGIHVRYVRDTGVEVRLSFQAVFDPVRYSSDKKRGTITFDWSLHSLFDRTIDRSCPVAQSSKIFIRASNEDSAKLSPEPTTSDKHSVIFDVLKTPKPLDIAMTWPDEPVFQYPLSPPPSALTHLAIQRTLTGPNQSRGHLTVSITNNEAVPIKAGYLETMPWLLQFYLHSLKVTSNGTPREDLVSIVSYVPPVPHARPALLQALISLPANSTVVLTMDVVKPFLRYTEHPPDAQRGWDLPPAVFIPFGVDGEDLGARTGSNHSGNPRHDGRLHRLYSPTLLVDLATPDFSMPYNVIIMSCTLIALIFGSVFNLLTRKFVIVSLRPETPKVVE
ncbi:hypothetical protein NM688_g2479 [Phlebia brevispora]|uniref:Uncharacterized protein n=1 Tax=Phlebia brevispora TaxID=194682 RepID=A0ACC1T8E0_9APHY|nr:hypothetical protein NM688_g2479 [Phlebia brevispora]